MHILVLLNGAPYKDFFLDLIERLRRDGHRVSVLYDSVVTREYLGYTDAGLHGWILSDHLQRKRWSADDVAREFRLRTIGDVFFSDIERKKCVENSATMREVDWESTYFGTVNLVDTTLRDEKIDLVIYEAVSNSFARIVFDVCKVRNVPFYGLLSSRLPGRVEICKSLFFRIDPSQREPAPEFDVAGYVARIQHVEPDYMAVNARIEHAPKVKSLYTSLSKGLAYYRALRGARPLHHAYQYSPFLATAKYAFLVKVMRWWNQAVINRIRPFDVETLADCDERGEKFFVYPIHFHPESSTSIMGRHYTDELNTIQSAAMSVPIGYKLYVKEHLSSFGLNAPRFYEQIRKNPNVVCVDPRVNARLLVERSEGVITVSSTVGYEALLLKKPAFVLGDVFYDEFRGAVKLSGFPALEEALLDYVSDPARFADFAEEDVAKYVECTRPASLDMTLKGTDEVYRVIATEIARDFGAHATNLPGKDD